MIKITIESDTFKMSNIKCGLGKLYTFTICQTMGKVYIGYPGHATEVCFMLPSEDFTVDRKGIKFFFRKVIIITSRGIII